MGKQTLEELKQAYPRLWEKACREFEDEEARKKAFLALVELQKAKVKEQITKEKLRKKRTRALILFASALIRELDKQELRNLIQRIRKHLIAREGRREVDYLPFLVEEIKNVKENFEFKIKTEEIKSIHPELAVNPNKTATQTINETAEYIKKVAKQLKQERNN